MMVPSNAPISAGNAPRLESADASSASPSSRSSEGIRDTIESIILAIIFAFVFRAFVVEAFVIPTGSMAPGLYGQHFKHRCALCQYPYAVGVPPSLQIPRHMRCPNCGWPEDGLRAVNKGSGNYLPPPDSGDRILVLKWPYDIGGSLLGPRRWDVVVFKDPEDGDQNFIKRLLGMPGEVLEIIDGEIYTAPLSAVREDIRDALSRPPPMGNPRIRRLSDEQQLALAKVLTIQRKVPLAQESLWMLHYDNDFQPDLTRVQGAVNIKPPAWRPRGEGHDSAWNASSPAVRFQPQDNLEHWLDLAGKPIQDNYGYNEDPAAMNSPLPARSVGDVRLRFVLLPLATEGSLLLQLRKGSDEFHARISADGTVSLDKAADKGIRIRLKNAKIEPLHANQPVMIEFENVDYRVTLRVSGEVVFATDDVDYAPDITALLRAARGPDTTAAPSVIAIGGAGLAMELRHLTVHRDVYYRSDRFFEDPFSGYPGWGTEFNPILLRADPADYFCCGDNSPQSKDSRLWWKVCPALAAREGDARYQYGTVPGDQLIGRAFFVYWPSGIRPSPGTPAVIPNFGRMRIIR